MERNPACHRCAGTFPSRGRLLYHKLRLCPVPITRRKPMLRVEQRKATVRGKGDIAMGAEGKASSASALSNSGELSPQSLRKEERRARLSTVRQDPDLGRWLCVQCGKAFDSKQDALAHTRRSKCSGQAKYSCSKCSYATNIKRELGRHAQSLRCSGGYERIRTVVRDPPKKPNSRPTVTPTAIECSKCSRRFGRPAGLYAHLSDSVSCGRLRKQTFTCPRCGQTMSAARRYYHITWSSSCGTKIVSCDECGRSISAHDITGHVSIHRGQSKELSRGSRQRKHVNLPIGKGREVQWKSLLCPGCGYETAFSSRMREHLASPLACSLQKIAQSLAGLKDERGDWKCPKCSKAYSKRSILRAHIQYSRCRTVSRYACTGCDFTTNDRCLLGRHLASRVACSRRKKAQSLAGFKDERGKWKCPHCGYESTQSTRMRAHLASRLACAIQKRAQRLAALQGATRCSRCQRSFTTSRNLLDHLDRKACR